MDGALSFPCSLLGMTLMISWRCLCVETPNLLFMLPTLLLRSARLAQDCARLPVMKHLTRSCAVAVSAAVPGSQPGAR